MLSIRLSASACSCSSLPAMLSPDNVLMLQQIMAEAEQLLMQQLPARQHVKH
jgi:hypothetical protein